MSITLQNLVPYNGERNVSSSTLIQADVILTSSTIAEIEIYVEGILAFKGSDIIPFHSPFNGPLSSVAVIPGGFSIVLNNTGSFLQEFINVQFRRTIGSSSLPIGGWSFRVGSGDINDFYLSDGYYDSYGNKNPETGVRRIHIRQLVGELKPHENFSDNVIMPVILSVDVTPNWPSDIVRSISSQFIDGYLFLVTSTDKGVIITKNETSDLRIYNDGYDSYGGYLTDEGTLYLINKNLNGGKGGVDVYYGADFRSGSRSSDFTYDSSISTPERVRLLDGNLNVIHVAEGASTILSGGSRLYVGCSEGFTKIEAYDEGTDGYCDGYDAYGRSYTYGILGSTTQYPIIGGIIPNVVAINSDETLGVIFVATNNNTEIGGGLSQLSISRNIRLMFMTKESGQLPSNVVKDIAI